MDFSLPADLVSYLARLDAFIAASGRVPTSKAAVCRAANGKIY